MVICPQKPKYELLSSLSLLAFISSGSSGLFDLTVPTFVGPSSSKTSAKGTETERWRYCRLWRFCHLCPKPPQAHWLHGPLDLLLVPAQIVCLAGLGGMYCRKLHLPLKPTSCSSKHLCLERSTLGALSMHLWKVQACLSPFTLPYVALCQIPHMTKFVGILFWTEMHWTQVSTQSLTKGNLLTHYYPQLLSKGQWVFLIPMSSTAFHLSVMLQYR